MMTLEAEGTQKPAAPVTQKQAPQGTQEGNKGAPKSGEARQPTLAQRAKTKANEEGEEPVKKVVAEVVFDSKEARKLAMEIAALVDKLYDPKYKAEIKELEEERDKHWKELSDMLKQLLGIEAKQPSSKEEFSKITMDVLGTISDVKQFATESRKLTEGAKMPREGRVQSQVEARDSRTESIKAIKIIEEAVEKLRVYQKKIGWLQEDIEAIPDMLNKRAIKMQEALNEAQEKM
jgi:hypothetical protein